MGEKYEDPSIQIEDQIKYSNTDILQFSYLEMLDKTNERKNLLLLSVVVFCLVSIIFSYNLGFSNYISKTSFRPFDINYWAFIIVPISMYFLNILFSFILHKGAYNKVLKARCYAKGGNECSHSIDNTYVSKFKVEKLSLKDRLKYFLSPDLFFANKYKNELIQHKYVDDDGDIAISKWSTIRIERKSFIEYSNWLNIIFTTIMFGIISILNIIFMIKRNDWNNELANSSFLLLGVYKWILVFLLIRLVSRGVEIVLAFYNDVAKVNSKIFKKKQHPEDQYFYYNGFTSSLIRQNGRLSLAVHTLIEMMLLFAMIYYLFFNIFYEPSLKNFPPNLYETLLMSMSLGVFNISFEYYQNPIMAFAHVSQVMVSCVLILLSIAQYLGASRFVTKGEHDLYMNHARIRNEFDALVKGNKKSITTVKMGNDPVIEEMKVTETKVTEINVNGVKVTESKEVKMKPIQSNVFSEAVEEPISKASESREKLLKEAFKNILKL